MNTFLSSIYIYCSGTEFKKDFDSVKAISPIQDVILPTIVSRVTRGDGRFVDLMIILY